jgi:hypothetical protein
MTFMDQDNADFIQQCMVNALHNDGVLENTRRNNGQLDDNSSKESSDDDHNSLSSGWKY